MKKILNMILVIILVPVFLVIFLLAIVPMILLLMLIFSILAGRTWVGGIKWDTTSTRRDARRSRFKSGDTVEIDAHDSVYDVQCDVLNVTPKQEDENDESPEKTEKPSIPS